MRRGSGRRRGASKALTAGGAAILLVAAQASPPPAGTEAARVAWGFAKSDLIPHPGVRFGVLPNGMRYALMANAGGGLSARLHVAAGAAVEEAREAGSMHLIEHLIFHGSANLGRGVLPLMLQHQGMRRFSDFNAYTTADETVYRLDLAKADARARATALTVMRDIASGLRFDRETVDRVKAEVQAEIAARDRVRDRIEAAQNALFVPTAPVVHASVTGTEAEVRRARGAVLERLYRRHYVPRRTTLVLVGDFDPASAEAEIAARFADWRAAAPAARATIAAVARPAPPPPALRERGVEARLFVDAAAPTAVVVASVRPSGSPDAAARRDAAYLEHLGAGMLSRRLAASAEAGEAAAAIYEHGAAVRLARIDVAAPDRDWQRALRRGARALAAALRDGFSQGELDVQLAASGRALAADAAPRTGAALADAITDAVGRRIVFTAPGDGSAARAYLARVRLADVNAAFRAAWANGSRLIFVSHGAPVPGGGAAVLAAWREEVRKAGE